MAIQIPLTQGVFAVVDDSDAALVMAHRWSLFTPPRNGLRYAVTKIDNKMVGLHRIIMGLPDEQVDHKDGDGLNNQRSNLRLCTQSQNQMNAKKRLGTSSRFKGVSWVKHIRKWSAKIKKDGETVSLGYFASEDAAARQYDRAARIFFGKFARTNEALGLYDEKLSA